MTDAEVQTGGSRLGRRPWTAVGAIIPATAVATVVGCCLAAGLTGGVVQVVAVALVLLVGMAAGFLWGRLSGAEAIHRRVAAARADWVRSSRDATLEPDGMADPRDVALALPRGWRVEVTRGRLRFAVAGTAVRAETWVLRAVVGSRRAPRRREVVAAGARTGDARLWMPVGTTADSMLVTPAWAPGADASAPGWMPAVRDRIDRHEDLPAALTIGDDRVILFALDDPRPETMLARAQLVRDVAAMIR